MTLSIRPFAPGDMAMLQEIRRLAFAPVFASFRSIVGDKVYALALADSDKEQAELLNSLVAPGSAFSVHVVCDGDAPIGFVSISLNREKKSGEIGLNAVHPDRAGHGVGAWMYDWALQAMREAGMKVATVGTGGDPSHEPARRAYAKAGFELGIPSVWLVKPL